MTELLIVPHSLESKEEVSQISVIQSKTNRFIEKIDENLEVWILGKNQMKFWNENAVTPHKEGRVVDPNGNFPIDTRRELVHIAMVMHKNQDDPIIIFGNSYSTLYGFVIDVLNNLIREYPKKSDIKLVRA